MLILTRGRHDSLARTGKLLLVLDIVLRRFAGYTPNSVVLGQTVNKTVRLILSRARDVVDSVKILLPSNLIT